MNDDIQSSSVFVGSQPISVARSGLVAELQEVSNITIVEIVHILNMMHSYLDA
jgi:hypothetical protein